MQVETVSTSPAPVTASNPQDTQKNAWTCVNWYNTVFEIAARKTSRIFGHVVAGFVSVFTIIPSLTVDLTHAVISLYNRKISRPETPLENQVVKIGGQDRTPINLSTSKWMSFFCLKQTLDYLTNIDPTIFATTTQGIAEHLG